MEHRELGVNYDKILLRVDNRYVLSFRELYDETLLRVDGRPVCQSPRGVFLVRLISLQHSDIAQNFVVLFSRT